MIGLQARGQAAGQAEGGAEARDHAASCAADRDQVLQAHDLGDGGGHLGRQAGRERGQALGGGLLGEQPVAELADGQMRDGRERRGVVRIADQARDFVLFVGDEGLGEERLQRHIGQLHLGAHALLGGARRRCPASSSPGARGRGFRQQRLCRFIPRAAASCCRMLRSAATPLRAPAPADAAHIRRSTRCRSRNHTAAPITPLL